MALISGTLGLAVPAHLTYLTYLTHLTAVAIPQGRASSASRFD
jgi:hypothetical protein